jgi:hypothetical protein
MFRHTLQRRAFGVELWAMVPTRDGTDETYFVRVHGNGHIDRHFADATEALDAFFKLVREAMFVD